MGNNTTLGVKMIKVTHTEFIQNPSHIQHLAEQEPVLVENGDKTQVLMGYDQYAKLSGISSDKPFVSLYDALVTNMPDDLREALAQIDDENDEPDDFSYICQRESKV